MEVRPHWDPDISQHLLSACLLLQTLPYNNTSSTSDTQGPSDHSPKEASRCHRLRLTRLDMKSFLLIPLCQKSMLPMSPSPPRPTRLRRPSLHEPQSNLEKAPLSDRVYSTVFGRHHRLLLPLFINQIVSKSPWRSSSHYRS